MRLARYASRCAVCDRPRIEEGVTYVVRHGPTGWAAADCAAHGG